MSGDKSHVPDHVSSIPSVSWRLRQLSKHQFPCSDRVLEELCGGVSPGKIIELCGPANSGKTQLCFSMVTDCLRHGKKAIIVTTKSIPRRSLKRFPNPDNLFIVQVFSMLDLLGALSSMKTESYSLVVIDSPQPILQGILGSQNYRGQSLLNEVKLLLGQISEFRLIVYTNGIVSIGGDGHAPALGITWENTPTIRLMVIPIQATPRTQVWRNSNQKAELLFLDNRVRLKWSKEGDYKEA